MTSLFQFLLQHPFMALLAIISLMSFVVVAAGMAIHFTVELVSRAWYRGQMSAALDWVRRSSNKR